LNAHQSFVEDLLLKDIMERGWDVTHDLTFIDYQSVPDSDLLSVICSSTTTHQKTVVQARYLIGADGVHSTVRKLIGSRHISTAVTSSHGIWAVMDCTINTNFPDLYSKTVVHSEEAGTMIVEPRERNSTRLYVQMQTHIEDFLSKIDLSEGAVFDRVREILEPYTFHCTLLESAGCYQVARKTSSIFSDPTQKVFLIGDAAYSASPMAHGMNTALASSVNLAWKLNLSLRGLAAPSLLSTYSTERKSAATLQSDADADELDALTCGSGPIYAENALRHARWAAGYAVDYAPDGLLSVAYPGSEIRGDLRVGSSMPPSKVTRWIDAAPVDLQIDVPLIGTFKLYFFCKSLQSAREYVELVVAHCFNDKSVIGRANRKAEASYSAQPPVEATSDDWVRPERYTVVSGLFTFGLVLGTSVDEIESSDLPTLWKNSTWTVYADDVPHLDTRGMGCMEKYLGGISVSEVAVVVVRPDNYVGTIVRGRGSKENAQKACGQLDGYFGGFMNI
jgi:phenol 2-monooxygenase